ncbi:nuclear RNA export factor 1 [Nilaparvata lugens]|uniref:nuclear RNA export factor 1 n=1 Tax=Nilaparvata lugens TaxID=108931 RepID=UPI00193E1981|nr:nuclear RNA export factor 1 [Nilaparvata lugens]
MPNIHRRGGRDRNYGDRDNRGGGGGGSRDKDYINNAEMGGTAKRVWFKGGQHRDNRAVLSQAILQRRILIDDGDIDMMSGGRDGGGGSGRHNNNNNNRSRGFRRQNFSGRNRNNNGGGFSGPPPKRFLEESFTGWYKARVVGDVPFDKDETVSLLSRHIGLQFIAYSFQKVNNEVTFYLETRNVAEKLNDTDRKITLPDGHKMRLFVKPISCPVDMTDELRENIKLVMAKRYRADTKALDLKKFHSDPDFLTKELLVPLMKPNVLNAVVQTICKNIPDIVAIDLSENRLSSLDQLKPLIEKAAVLQILHLHKNSIRHERQLDALQGLGIVELMLEDNPVCNKLKDKTAYVREVRKRFPNVIRLDNETLPPPITFDIENDTRLKPSLGSYTCNPEGALVVSQFIELYYTIFDSDDRQPLINAYHEKAQFSFTCSPGMGSYLSDNRNLFLIGNNDTRLKLLKTGPANIVSFLSSIVKTQHDPASFCVDLTLYTPQLLALSISGVFREVNKKVPMRSFNRSLVIVPSGTGYCIINDMLFFTSANPDQISEAFKVIANPPVVAAPPAPAPVVVSPVIPTPTLINQPTLQVQEQMVSMLSLQTGMNIPYSKKCMEENQWDFNRALFAFNECNKTGSIPADAFIK